MSTSFLDNSSIESPQRLMLIITTIVELDGTVRTSVERITDPDQQQQQLASDVPLPLPKREIRPKTPKSIRRVNSSPADIVVVTKTIVIQRAS